jgi:hypothetical protein
MNMFTCARHVKQGVPLVFLGWMPGTYLLLALSSTGLYAQTINGRLLDEATDEAISSATIRLLDRDEPIGGVLSDDAGRFRLEVPRTGRYRIRAERIGYRGVTSPPIDIVDGQTLEVELRLSTEAVPLAPLTIISDRPPRVLDPRLERWGYYRRRGTYGKEEGMGFASFLDEEDIERRIAFRVSDLLGEVPGVRIRPAGGMDVQITGRRGCPMTIYVDGVRYARGGGIDGIISPSAIVAAEIYPGFVSSVRFPGGSCGAVVLWTGMRR